MNKSYNRREVLTGAGVVMTAALAPNFLAAGNTFEVLMLNKDPDNSKKKMVFSPSLLKVAVGDQVSEGDVVIIMESMKMETEVHATASGTINSIQVQEGQKVNTGDNLLVIS